MSVTSAMYTGVSGLMSNSQAMNVIGNNISNVNTVGFKSGRTVFSDMLSDSMGSAQIGTGSQVQAVNNLFTQGSAQQTGNVTDLSIAGNSFFALKAPGTPVPVTRQDAAYLTRAGAFHVDNSLSLVNPDGFLVLDTEGNPIRFSDTFPDQLTSFSATYGGLNLPTLLTNDLAAVAAPAVGADATLLTAATNANNAVAAAAGAYSSAPSASSVSNLQAAITAAYNAIVAANNSAPVATRATLNAGANFATFTSAADDVATAWKTSFGSVTEIAQDGTITFLGRDGITENYYNKSGSLGVAVNAANLGTVQRVALVSVMDPTALQKEGGSLYRSAPGAGVAPTGFSLLDNKANGTSEKILSNSLESSNVDLANEFVNMITTQRAYSANSKTITTTDQMTQEVLQLIR